MKNIEKYEKKITEYVNKGCCVDCAIATAAGFRETTPCIDQECDECEKKCIKWMFSEYKEEILSDDEKDIIKEMLDVILKFGCEVNYVRKKYDDIYGKAYVLLSYENSLTKYSDIMTTPWFKKDKFKGMEIGKEYKLEELGITCPTQKDN